MTKNCQRSLMVFHSEFFFIFHVCSMSSFSSIFCESYKCWYWTIGKSVNRWAHRTVVFFHGTTNGNGEPTFSFDKVKLAQQWEKIANTQYPEYFRLLIDSATKKSNHQNLQKSFSSYRNIDYYLLNDQMIMNSWPVTHVCHIDDIWFTITADAFAIVLQSPTMCMNSRFVWKYEWNK